MIDITGQEGILTHYSWLGANLMETIKSLKKCKASLLVFATFSGLAKKYDLTHVKLRETG